MGTKLAGLVMHTDTYSIFLGFVALVILSHIIGTIYDVYIGPLSKVPGPKSRAISLLPQSLMFIQGREITDIPALHRQYGDVVRMGPKTLSFIGTPDAWKDIYGFKKAGQLENSKDLGFYEEPMNGYPDILFSSASEHPRQRKIVSHAFSDRALKEQGPMLKMWAGKLRDFLMRKYKDEGGKVDMVRAYTYTTFDLMADLTFAEPLYMLDNSEYVPWVKSIYGHIKMTTIIRTGRALSKTTRWIIDELAVRIPSMNKMKVEHWNYTAVRVNKRLAEDPSRPDIWTHLLEKGGDPNKPNATLSLGEHHSIAALFMFAGTETTSAALSGLTYYLLRNPEWMNKLKAEIRAEANNVDGLSLEALAKLPILDACIKEGLRMYPPVPTGTPRVAAVDCMVAGHFVPKGTSIYIHHIATYRAEHLFKNAYEFHPERWLGDPEYMYDIQEALEPFSFGPRNCLGKNLAWHEMRLLLSAVLIDYDLELLPECENWSDQKVFTVWEKKDLLCKLKPVNA